MDEVRRNAIRQQSIEEAKAAMAKVWDLIPDGEILESVEVSNNLNHNDGGLGLLDVRVTTSAPDPECGSVAAEIAKMGFVPLLRRCYTLIHDAGVAALHPIWTEHNWCDMASRRH